MQNRHMTSEEKNPKSREEWKKINGGMPLLTDLCPNEVGPDGYNPGSRGGGNLHLRSSSDVRISRSPGDNVSLLCNALESYQRTGWDGAQLVSAGGAQGTNEQYGTLWKSERCRVDSVQLQGTAAM